MPEPGPLAFAVGVNMITDKKVDLGTVLHFNFDALNGASGEMHGRHPAVVITPASRQAHRTVIVVPLTSSLGNVTNPYAVEINRGDIVDDNKRTGRTFAICNLPIALSLDRADLDYFHGHDTEGNFKPRYVIRGEELRLIRLLVMKQFWNNKEFHSLLGDQSLVTRLRTRQENSRKAEKSRKTPKSILGKAAKYGPKSAVLRPGNRLRRTNGPKAAVPRPVAGTLDRE